MKTIDVEIVKNELRNEVLYFLNFVNKDNFWRKYDELACIVLSYKDRLSKLKAYELICEICSMDLDENQEEVVIEIGNRLGGYCPLGLEIDW